MTSLDTFSQSQRIDVGDALRKASNNLDVIRHSTERTNDKVTDLRDYMRSLLDLRSRIDSLLVVVRTMLLMQVVSTAALVASLVVLMSE
jgi:signal transduction histidine kinase